MWGEGRDDYGYSCAESAASMDSATSVILLRLPWYLLKEPLRSQGKEDGPQPEGEGLTAPPSIPDKSARVLKFYKLLETGLHRACRHCD